MADRKVFLFSLLLLISATVFAQDPGGNLNEKSPEALVKEKQERGLKLLEQIMTDAKNLRLPENRAYVLARVGSALWKSDEKTARKLFQTAVADLIAAQTEVRNEKTASRQYYQALFYGQAPRQEIINLIAARDAELALEYLEKSRPPAIAEAVRKPSNDNNSTVQQFASAEFAIEQRLIGLAAEQNPQLHLKRLRESLKRGFSYETVNLLTRIQAKDPQLAEKLAEEAAEGFLSVDYSKYSETAEAAGYFVSLFGRVSAPEDKSVKISDELLRRVLTKMTDDWLNSKTAAMYGYNNSAAVVEKIFPERAARLKKKLQTNNNLQDPEAERYSKIMAAETAPDEMISQAEKFQPAYRNEIYRAAAARFVQNGNIAEAEKIMQTNFSEEQSESYLSQFYANLAYQYAAQGKFEEATDFANRVPDEHQRINTLISVASSAYSRSENEHRILAQAILNQARALIPNEPETQNEMMAAFQLASAYAPIDAGESFRIIEGSLATLNELIQANFVLMRYRNYGGGVRQSEIQLLNGNVFVSYNLDNSLRVLKEKDFERTLQFVNGFNRLEARIWMQLQLIDENFSVTNLPLSSRRIINFN